MKLIARIFLVCLTLILPQFAAAQDALAPLNRDYYHMVDRMDITDSTSSTLFTSHKPLRRQILGEYMAKKMRTFESTYLKGSPLTFLHVDQFMGSTYDLNYIGQDNWEFVGAGWRGRMKREKKGLKRFPNGFFNTPAAAYSVDEENFNLTINPVLGFAKTFDRDDTLNLFQNTRGVQLRGSIGKKLGFYSFVSENQFRYPSFYRNQIDTQGVIPGVGFYKTFKKTGHDFFTARGYITFSPIEEIALQFGHDQNFIGDGYRSLIWSDNAKENLFLKVQTQVWKIRYMNIFSELSDVDRVIGNGEGIDRKYSSFHHLTVALKPNLHIGFFEQVIFDRSDSISRGSYELNYLNPMIFYRAVEHGLNSSDNVIVGMNWKWNFMQHFSIYGQYVLDEFKKDELFARTGWWGNKWAFQSGVKWINAFNTQVLDLQYEFNAVRPYTYSHFTASQSYTNYKQSMAHPLGANFTEHCLIARAHPIYPIFVVGKLFYSVQGLDSSTKSFYSYGADLNRPYLNRPAETGIKIGDGIKNEVLTAEFRVSLLFYHNLFVDINYVYRKQNELTTGNSPRSGIVRGETTNFVSLGLRYNLPYKSFN